MEDIKEIENADTIVEISETKSTQPHNGEEINRIIISQYIEDDPYVVTYSEEDDSILGWSVNIEEIGQQPDVYFKFDGCYYIDIRSFALYKKILVFSDYYERCKYLF